MSGRVWLFVGVLSCSALPAGLAHGKGWMHWPVSRDTSAGAPLTQGFYGDYVGYCGSRDGCGTHNGYDYGIPSGIPLYAVAPGVVDAIHSTDTKSPEFGNAGLWVRVRHDAAYVPGLDGSYYVAYLHMSSIAVSVGDEVTPETMLGKSGTTGGVAAHLHLHLSKDGTYCPSPVDPGCPTPTWVAGSVIPDTFVGAPSCQALCKSVPILWVQPARYGGEAYLAEPPCGSLDYAGRCDGETLHWCEAGGEKTADCSATARVCGYQDAVVGYNCLTCEKLGGARCEGARWLRCEGAVAMSTDCDAAGQVCTPTGCVDAPIAEPPLGGGEAGGEGGADAPVDRPADEPRDASGGESPPAKPDGAAADGGANSGDAGPSADASGGCGCGVDNVHSSLPFGAAWIAAALLLRRVRRQRA